MSIAEYRAAKDRLKQFDEWAAKVGTKGAEIVWKSYPTVTLSFNDDPYYPQRKREIEMNPSLNHTLRDEMDIDFLEAAIARTRARLVAYCARHKITAANEARGIIAEDAPK